MVAVARRIATVAVRSTMHRRDFIRTIGAAAVGGRAARAAAATRRARQAPVRRASAASPGWFDFIIVGAGATGCVVAHRLSADPAVRVLLIEAGGPERAEAAVATLGRWPSLLGSAWDWGYVTEAEPGLDGRHLAYPRGKGPGGSAAIGAMTFVRGHRLSYDRWRALGNTGWGYDDLVPLFKRSERNQSGASEFRGGDGPLSVEYCWDPHPAHRAFLTAAIQNGFRADARFDFNGPSTAGVAGFFQKTLRDGARQTTAGACLAPALSRPNLEVTSGARAARLLMEGRRVTGVEYLRGTRREQAHASRQVVLCGGVLDSPKLLMLSGVGPADHLRAHGVAVVADVPGVGQNLQDHVEVPVRWTAAAPLPGSTVTAGIFLRSTLTAESVERAPDLLLSVGRGLDRPDRSVTIAVALVQPQSRGEIRLQSADAAAAPLIRLGILDSAADVEALVRGVRLARWFGDADSFKAILGDESDPGPAVASASGLAAYLRRSAGTIGHSAGTCRMGPDNDPMAVVDAGLRVRGVEGLLVADASVMPEIVNAPTTAACVMIGERAADLAASSP